jgi:hypothetical protein
MELWLRHRIATRGIAWDERVDVASHADWLDRISAPGLVSSILWVKEPTFRPVGSRYLHRSHHHERGYVHDPARNASYREACIRLAGRLAPRLAGRRTLVYAPLRGALPIWRTVAQFLPAAALDVHYPVTSSFVSYSSRSGISDPRGRRASGRYANVLELERLRPFLSGYDQLVYVDEIVSGGMMRGHLKELLAARVHQGLEVIVVGLADRFGERSIANRGAISAWVSEGKLGAFLWEGCQELITEDQRFLLGVHYPEYDLGPHVVPVIDESFEYYEEKRLLEADLA